MPEQLTPKFELEVGGSPVDAVLAEAVIVIRVHMHLQMADCLEVRLSNSDLEWTESDTLAEGTEVAVSMGYQEGDFEKLFVGEIIRRDCEFPVSGPAIVTIVALDKAHALKRGKHGKVWLNQKDSDIVSEICGDVGLSGDVEDTKVQHEWVFQSNETHLAFIRRRAAQYGFIASVDRENKKLAFKKPEEGSGVTTLKWGENLLSFHPRMSSDEQVSKVTVRGWDPMDKKMVEGTADTSKIRMTLGAESVGAKAAEKKYGSRETMVVTQPVTDASAATAMAEAAINAKAEKFCQAEGSCQGDPKIIAGAVLTIEGVGKRAGGDYSVNAVLHHLEPAAGYSSNFTLNRSTDTKGETPPEEQPPTVERESEEGEEEHYVEIKIRSQTGDDLTGLNCKVTMPNGEVKNMTLGEDHILRIEGIKDPGEAQIEFEPPEDLEVVGDND